MVLASEQFGVRPERKDEGHSALCNLKPAIVATNNTPKSPKKLNNKKQFPLALSPVRPRLAFSFPSTRHPLHLDDTFLPP